ncbi:MAG: polysaccharide pyruvyl transferase family protein [Selenomonas ruminantium]|nr:polysaccharide pyruvyl transferase family protein [Selenomonas ruminantium]
MPTIMIIGANFANKGAQSMLFTTVGIIKKRFPKSKIIFAHGDECDISNFNFEEVYYSPESVMIALHEHKNRVIISRYIKNFIKKILGRKVIKMDCKQLNKIISKVDFIVDISGFSLGSKWGDASVYRYTNNIKLAKKYNIPIILMPQSFGDFEWKNNRKKLDNILREYMQYPIHIFAREKDGEILLRQYGLKNVTVHPDMILCSVEPDISLIYKEVPIIQVPEVTSEHNVGILPNMRSFEHGNKIEILDMYRKIIRRLLERGKTVYLFRHSFEDLIACRWIKEMFHDEERVVLWENDFSCFEYDAVCRKFEFLIVGRFHGIVHAYRNNVPCVILGWAIKYKELSKIMGQELYVFDVTNRNIEADKIVHALDDMDENLLKNKDIIRERLAQVQSKSTCFNVMLKGIEDVANKKMAY